MKLDMIIIRDHSILEPLNPQLSVIPTQQTCELLRWE